MTGRIKVSLARRYAPLATDERPNLFHSLFFVETSDVNRGGAFAKIGSSIELSLLRKVNRNSIALRDRMRPDGRFRIYYTRKLSHFVQILDFIPKIIDGRGKERSPSELKSLEFGDNVQRDCYLAVFNSSLFYWLLTVYFDCRNLNKREVESLQFDPQKLDESEKNKLEGLCRGLMKDIKKNAKMLTMHYKTLGKLQIECTYPKFSKSLIDEIDSFLAKHFALSMEELDFLVNYDIKYRMGVSDTEDDDGA